MKKMDKEETEARRSSRGRDTSVLSLGWKGGGLNNSHSHLRISYRAEFLCQFEKEKMNKKKKVVSLHMLLG